VNWIEIKRDPIWGSIEQIASILSTEWYISIFGTQVSLILCMAESVEAYKKILFIELINSVIK